MAAKQQSREDQAAHAAADRGWRLEKVGRRFRLVNADTGTVVADDWATGEGLALDDIEQAFN